MTEREYEEAKAKLREHYATCNCFLPNVSCEPWVEELGQEASNYWLLNRIRRGA